MHQFNQLNCGYFAKTNKELFLLLSTIIHQHFFLDTHYVLLYGWRSRCFHHVDQPSKAPGPCEKEKEGQTSSDSRSCSLHAPNPLLSSTCHTLAAKWNWLLISFLPQVSCDGGLRWAHWEAWCGTAGGEGTTQRGNTQPQPHKHIFLITTVSHGAVCKDRRCCTSGGCNMWRVTFQSFNKAWVKEWGSWSQIRIWSKGKDFIVWFFIHFFFYDLQMQLRTVLPSLPDSLGWPSCLLRNWKCVGVLQETVKTTWNPRLQKRPAFL